VALVVGPGPAAAATVAATIGALGAGTPSARWVADLHAELLDRSRIAADDARPSAWFEAAKLTANGIPRARLTEWLEPQFVDTEGEPLSEVVVSDAGLPWLLGLWGAAALRCDAEPANVVVLQPATDVATDLSGVAGWLNLVLHTERGTRGQDRAFVRYADVLTDWTIPFVELGRAVPLRSVQEATANQIRKGHSVVAGGHRPSVATWDQLDAPAGVRELAEETWAALAGLADPDGDTAERQATLDQLRAAYVATYDQAEALTRSTARAARLEGRDQETSDDGDPGGGVRRGLRSAGRRALGRDR
jgi:hypothetical protein